MNALKVIAVIVGCGIVTAIAFFLADMITTNESFRSVITESGVFGAIAIAFICGLTFVVPVPPATFAPVFLEAGLSIPLVVMGFVVGTMAADTIGYVLGWVGKSYAETAHPRITKRLHECMHAHTHVVLPFAFVYFAVAPLPNELILVPLALSGYRYRTLVLPMLFGTIIHHTLLVLGYQTVFERLF